MSRTISASTKTAAESSVVRPITLVKLAYDSGTTYASSADRDFVYDGDTYLGLGMVGAIASVEESAEVKANGVSCTLSGIPNDYVSDALNEDYQGRDAQIFLGLLDSSYALIADPLLIFRGRIDTQDIAIGQTATVSVTIESRLIDWERPRVRRYTNEDQQSLYTGDKGLEFVSQMVEKEIVWPGAA